MDVDCPTQLTSKSIQSLNDYRMLNTVTGPGATLIYNVDVVPTLKKGKSSKKSILNNKGKKSEEIWGASKMPTRVKVLAVMPDYLNSIPETYMVEGQVQSTSETTPSTHGHVHIKLIKMCNFKKFWTAVNVMKA